VKDEKVYNVHLEFHIILVIFEILVEFAIMGGEENKSNL